MDRKKIREICESLTNREKAILVTMQWLSPDQENYLEPYGIEKLRLSDSPKCPDYMMEDDETWEKTTDHTVCFPSPAAQASSWSKEMLAELGRRMGAAAKERGLHGLYRPAVNIKRYTLNGRNGEYFSEDPVLAGELAASFIQAVQSRGVAATVKHYAVNSQEFERMCMNAVVSERALREIYLRVFQIAIEKGNPWMLMTSYNKVNGSYVNENGLLMDILRKEWNYDGFVVSDGGAVQNGTAVSAHRNGMDFELGAHIADVQNALDRGELSAEAVDNNIRRIIELCEKAAGTDCAEKENRMDDHRFARKFAADTLILLKNDNAVLPLKKTDNIAVIGTFAKYCHFACGGSAFSNPYIKENSYDEIVKLAGRKMSSQCRRPRFGGSTSSRRGSPAARRTMAQARTFPPGPDRDSSRSRPPASSMGAVMAPATCTVGISGISAPARAAKNRSAPRLHVIGTPPKKLSFYNNSNCSIPQNYRLSIIL